MKMNGWMQLMAALVVVVALGYWLFWGDEV
jgi:hypothetical protein